jgi:hypothetical protein
MVVVVIWNTITCSNAALGGHLDILQWAIQNDWTCTYVAKKWSIGCSKMSKKNLIGRTW